ncbi:ROK family protein [Nocardia sp. alder85J]|uniref:ROK family protein n=1 Tax=Nocardia sp. alder85J TaxID=2862949 RepID=UPI001CD65E1B|nr:ROK family protein [Nocardia sp. alder85J]MCX4098862.1 ROK family protein [Nocardia sp. alder85J]
MSTPADLVLAVDVGGTTTKAEITDAAGAVLTAAAIGTPPGLAALDAVADLGDRLLTELVAAQRNRVTRAAVVIPGIVDPARAVAVFSSNLGWRDVAVGDRFGTRWGIPVLLEHDVAVAGWAEWRLGAGRGHDDVCVLILGTGIAGTLSVAGRLVRAAPGQAGEFGHIPIRHRDGLPCPCGNIGCVETVASGAAIARAYAARTGRGPRTGTGPRTSTSTSTGTGSSTGTGTGTRSSTGTGTSTGSSTRSSTGSGTGTGSGSGSEILDAAAIFERLPSDPDARAVIADAVDALADGLLGILHATRVPLIVLGGGLSGAGPILSTALHTRLTERLRVIPVPRVTLGAFGPRAGLIGAAHYARTGALE